LPQLPNTASTCCAAASSTACGLCIVFRAADLQPSPPACCLTRLPARELTRLREACPASHSCPCGGRTSPAETSPPAHTHTMATTTTQV
jgi:hypothetical protein